MKRVFIGLVCVAALQGCSTVGVDQMTSTGGMVTSARNGYPFDETPVKRISQRDSLVVISHIQSDPLVNNAGTHAVSWTWYENGKVVAVRDKDVKFDQTPFRLFWRMPAGNFAPGHYRVTVAIDHKVIDTQEYDII